MIKKIHFNNEVSSTEKKTFEFAPSVQSDLFNYLKPAQRKAIRPFLQIIKRPWQEKLCISLMDYLEGNGLNELHQPVLRFLQQQIIEECNLHPLTSSRAAGSKFQVSGFRLIPEPKSIGTLIKELFPSFKNLKHETGKAL